ncbi:DAK2 domain-containing protein [Streptomyces physcomitrii]|uniref:DAK2 domain-containing protein n=1 Tax=Streptomyces physcomitrii TaxID=2724184 RepID=UPI0005911CFA
MPPSPPSKEARVPQFLDAGAVRVWCALALGALGRAREEIDAINVYPVADGDTGTNLYLTLESAAQEIEQVFTGGGAPESAGAGHPLSLGEAVRAMAYGALIGARGNSGTILAQLLRGMAEVLAQDAPGPVGRDRSALPGSAEAQAAGVRDGAAPPAESGDRASGDAADGRLLALALRRAADSAYQAVAHPVEGTVLTVATAAARAADRLGGERDCGAVARAAYEGARTALAATRGQLAVLDRAGVVDAGGRGLVAVLAALVEALTGQRPDPAGSRGQGRGTESAADAASPAEPGAGGAPAVRTEAPPGPAAPECAEPAVGGSEAAGDTGAAGDDSGAADDGTGPAFEVIYLLEAEEPAVAALRERLDALGDSLVVVGGEGLWNVHVHVDDAGAAVEAGIEAGRPYRIRITHFAAGDVHTRTGRPLPARAPRAVVAVVPGEGLAELYAEAGATTVPLRPGHQLASAELLGALHRAHAEELVLLPNDTELRHTAAAAAAQARSEGLRVAVIPTRSAVQGLAALAVHEPERRFDEDVVQMTSAAGATRHGELAVAQAQSWTMAGVCQAGDVLGLIDGDVAVIGDDVQGMAVTVLDRMLSAGGELVTLVLGEEFPDTFAEQLEEHVRERHLAVDTVVYRGGRGSALLLVGVE